MANRTDTIQNEKQGEARAKGEIKHAKVIRDDTKKDQTHSNVINEISKFYKEIEKHPRRSKYETKLPSRDNLQAIRTASPRQLREYSEALSKNKAEYDQEIKRIAPAATPDKPAAPAPAAPAPAAQAPTSDNAAARKTAGDKSEAAFKAFEAAGIAFRQDPTNEEKWAAYEAADEVLNKAWAEQEKVRKGTNQPPTATPAPAAQAPAPPTAPAQPKPVVPPASTVPTPSNPRATSAPVAAGTIQGAQNGVSAVAQSPNKAREETIAKNKASLQAQFDAQGKGKPIDPELLPEGGKAAPTEVTSATGSLAGANNTPTPQAPQTAQPSASSLDQLKPFDEVKAMEYQMRRGGYQIQEGGLKKDGAGYHVIDEQGRKLMVAPTASMRFNVAEQANGMNKLSTTLKAGQTMSDKGRAYMGLPPQQAPQAGGVVTTDMRPVNTEQNPRGKVYMDALANEMKQQTIREIESKNGGAPLDPNMQTREYAHSMAAAADAQSRQAQPAPLAASAPNPAGTTNRVFTDPKYGGSGVAYGTDARLAAQQMATREAASRAATLPTAESQAGVVKKYPEVGVAGNPINKLFTDEYHKNPQPNNAMAIADKMFGEGGSGSEAYKLAIKNRPPAPNTNGAQNGAVAANTSPLDTLAPKTQIENSMVSANTAAPSAFAGLAPVANAMQALRAQPIINAQEGMDDIQQQTESANLGNAAKKEQGAAQQTAEQMALEEEKKKNAATHALYRAKSGGLPYGSESGIPAQTPY